MKRLLFCITLVTGTMLGPPAYADRNEEPCGGEESCSGGDCYKAKEPCSDDDLSPRFDDSPVRDSFNFGPVCVLPDSCRFDSPPEGETP